MKFEANVGVVMLQQRHDMHGITTLVEYLLQVSKKLLIYSDPGILPCSKWKLAWEYDIHMLPYEPIYYYKWMWQSVYAKWETDSL